MASHSAYCRGCNEDFPQEQSNCCPQCGEPLTINSGAATFQPDETIDAGVKQCEITHPDETIDRLLRTDFPGYTLQKYLGHGGMAWVFLATHDMLQRPCAIKVLNPELKHKSAGSVDQFLREARSAASLVHPHVVTVHNIGNTHEIHYIEMEFVPGQSLQNLRTKGRCCSPLEVTRYLLQTCSALAAAHQQGLVHRDFKPSNILVREDGIAKLADFGLAKRVSQESSVEHRSTATAGLAGTPYFMAPELFRGEQGSHASDVYAVGVSYYYLLTGSFPFQDRQVAKLAELHEKSPVPDLLSYSPDVPLGVVELIQRALSKKAEARYRNGGELHEELHQVFTQMRSLSSLIEDAVQDMAAKVREDQESLAVTITLDSGRSQTIHVEETESTTWSTQIVRVYSICGPADPSYFQRALELNSEVPHGSLAIESIDGAPHFVMLNSYLRSTINTIELRQSIRDIAQWADDVEQALTGSDHY